MYILLPMDSEDVQEATLTKIEDSKIWAQILIEDGELVEVNHNLDKDAPNDINIVDGYDLIMAKKMHMWGNGL